MSRIPTTLALFATLSTGVAFSQQTDTTGAVSPAPIERSYSAPAGYQPAPPQANRPPAYAQFNFTTVAPGIWVRSAATTNVQTLSATADKVELRLDHGVVNLNVHHPDHRPQILVDMPGGQTAVLKDGLYTFNADTNTVRTLKGEAEVFPGSNPAAKPVKVKEEHALTFNGGELKAYEFGPMELRGDLLPGAGPAHPESGYEGGYGPYGDGYYPTPYGGYGFYGDPYWGGSYWGYPFGFGLGFGYYGGFHRR